MICFHDTQSPDSGFRREKSAAGAAKPLCRAHRAFQAFDLLDETRENGDWNHLRDLLARL
jgi:hypothetical protein